MTGQVEQGGLLGLVLVVFEIFVIFACSHQKKILKIEQN